MRAIDYDYQKWWMDSGIHTVEHLWQVNGAWGNTVLEGKQHEAHGHERRNQWGSNGNYYCGDEVY